MDSTTLTIERQSAAEARVAELSYQAVDLLAATDGAEAIANQLLRCEATRRYSIAYEITRALARGDVLTAYARSLDSADHAQEGIAA